VKPQSEVPEVVEIKTEITNEVARTELCGLVVSPQDEVGKQDELIGVLSDELKKLWIVFMAIRSKFRKMPQDDEKKWEDMYLKDLVARRLFDEKCEEAFPDITKRLKEITEKKRRGSLEVRKGWYLVILNQELPTISLVAN